MNEQSLLNTYQIEHSFYNQDSVNQLRVNNNIFHEYQPHILGLLGDEARIILQKQAQTRAKLIPLKFEDFVYRIGTDNLFKALEHKYTIREFKKAYDFFIGLQTGMIVNHQHQELIRGFNFGLYEEVLKYYFSLAYDASSGAVDASGTATSLTFSQTCTGGNLILFSTAMIDKATDWVTGITYAGAAMTLVGKIQVSGGGIDLYIYLFYKINPATGANNVVISTSNATSIWGGAESLTSAKQTSQPDSSATNSGAVTDLTLSTTVVLPGCWLLSAATTRNTSLAAGTGTTSRNIQATAYSLGIGDSNGDVGTGSQSMHWTSSVATMAGVIASIASVADSGGMFLAL